MNCLRLICLHFLLLLAMVGQAPLRAGSPLPYPLLGEIENVDLTVSVGDLGWEPIPELDLRVLEREMRDKAHVALTHADFDVAEPAEAFFLITIKHAWNGEDRDDVALLVETSLEVLGQPVEASSRQLIHGRPTLTIWNERRLSLGSSAEARDIILRELDIAVKRLTEERRDAQRRQHSHPEP